MFNSSRWTVLSIHFIENVNEVWWQILHLLLSVLMGILRHCLWWLSSTAVILFAAWVVYVRFLPDCQKCWRRGITVSVVFVNSQICAMFSAMFNPPPPPKESKLSSKLLLYSLIIFCNWWIYAFAVWPWHVLASCMIDHCQYGLCNMIPFLNFATLCTCICEWV